MQKQLEQFRALCARHERERMHRAEQPPIGEQADRYLGAHNDGATLFAEMLQGSMRTAFEFSVADGEVYAENGDALGPILDDAIKDAERMAAVRPELHFEVRRRNIERPEHAIMVAMSRGEAPNTTVIVSDFPPELMHATKSVGGYNVERKQTMLRVLTWHSGKLHMYSQSLDGSNRQALEAIYAQFGYIPEPGELLGQRIQVELSEDDQKFITDRLTGVYDRSMAQQYGGNWYAGRPDERHDTYTFIRTQYELIDRYARAKLSGALNDRLIYNIAALLDKRFEQSKLPDFQIFESTLAFNGLTPGLDEQLLVAGNEARSEGKTFDGCGVSVGSTASSTKDKLGAAGYGNRADDDKDKLGSRWFNCPKGHLNYREFANIPEDNCRFCGTDVSCRSPEPPKPKPSRSRMELLGHKNSKPSGPAAHSESTRNVGGKVLAGAFS